MSLPSEPDKEFKKRGDQALLGFTKYYVEENKEYFSLKNLSSLQQQTCRDVIKPHIQYSSSNSNPSKVSEKTTFSANDGLIEDGSEKRSSEIQKMKMSHQDGPKKKVTCELLLNKTKFSTGPITVLQMFDYECDDIGGKILWYIEPLPANIPQNTYIKCRIPGEEKPVWMKAGSCLTSQGKIVNTQKE